MLKQQLNLKLSQKLSPQQIQLMKMIQLSTLDLEQKIEAEIGENPALESGSEKTSNENLNNDFEEGNKIETEDINIDHYLSDDETPSYKLYTNNITNNENDQTIPVSGGISFHQYLSQQIGNLILNENEMQIAEFIKHLDPKSKTNKKMSLIPKSEPTRLLSIGNAVISLQKK